MPNPPEIRLSTVVMAHPARRTRAESLAARLAARVVIDPNPADGPATLRTAVAAWSAVPGDATHHLVLQDDVLPGADLTSAVVAAVRHHPRAVLALFTEWGSWTSTAVRVAALCGLGWAELVDIYVPTQAVVLPADIAREAASVSASLPADTPDDHALRRFLEGAGIPGLAAVPNLVDHDDLPSLIGNHGHGLRRSACFLPAATADRVRAGSLTGLTDVPAFSWWSLRGERRVRANRTANLWWKEPLTGPAAPICPEVGLEREILDDVWRAAYATGLLAGRHGSDGGADDVASAAVASLAPGALRRLVDPTSPEGRTVYPRLAPFVASAVRTGIEAAR